MNPFHVLEGDKIIYDAMWNEILQVIDKYKKKFNEMRRVEDNVKGMNVFNMRIIVLEHIKKDKDLAPIYDRLQTRKNLTRKMVKKVFRDCLNEILDTEVVDGERVTSKRVLIAEKIVDGVLKDNLDPVTLRGFEVLRDSIGEKPASEVISKGIQQKIIDVNITKEKVDKVQGILDSLRGASVLDGFKQNNNIRTIDAGPGNERIVEAELSGEPERLHNTDVLPDKQD